MEKHLCMPEMPEDEFVANIEKDGFFRRYGNPVLIREKGGDGMVCMAAEYYERMARSLEALRGDAALGGDEDIRYWLYEFEMPPEDKEKFEKIAADNELTADELFEALVLSAVQHPAETAAAIREEQEHPHDDCAIRLVRFYPVHRGETEAQARKRAVLQEEAAKRKEKADAEGDA